MIRRALPFLPTLILVVGLAMCGLSSVSGAQDHREKEFSEQQVATPVEPGWFAQWGALMIATLVAVPVGIWMTRFYALKDKGMDAREKAVTDRETQIDEEIKTALATAQAAHSKMSTLRDELIQVARNEAEKTRKLLMDHTEADNAFQRQMERDIGTILGRIKE
jgi:uncharacterized membrane-anchored protein YhcB (DUF1043 family)